MPITSHLPHPLPQGSHPPSRSPGNAGFPWHDSGHEQSPARSIPQQGGCRRFPRPPLPTGMTKCVCSSIITHGRTPPHFTLRLCLAIYCCLANSAVTERDPLLGFLPFLFPSPSHLPILLIRGLFLSFLQLLVSIRVPSSCCWSPSQPAQIKHFSEALNPPLASKRV